MENRLMDGLKREHGNMRRALHIIRVQLDLMGRNEAPDFVLFGNALYYLRKFPGAVHHPKEELLFQRLLTVEPELRAEIESLREQHKQIYELEAWLQDAAVRASRSGAAAYPQLLEFGRRYLLIQSTHCKAEEAAVFPHALRALGPEDWRALLAQAQRMEDPSRGSGAWARFQAFYERVLAETPA